MTAAMEDAFMDELEPLEPEAFRASVDAAVVAYVLQMSHVLQWLAESDTPMAPERITAPARGRQYVHARLRMVAQYASTYPAIAALTDTMASAMRTQWPGCETLPLYPAFR
jgi:hypothetical protein